MVNWHNENNINVCLVNDLLSNFPSIMIFKLLSFDCYLLKIVLYAQPVKTVKCLWRQVFAEKNRKQTKYVAQNAHR